MLEQLTPCITSLITSHVHVVFLVLEFSDLNACLVFLRDFLLALVSIHDHNDAVILHDCSCPVYKQQACDFGSWIRSVNTCIMESAGECFHAVLVEHLIMFINTRLLCLCLILAWLCYSRNLWLIGDFCNLSFNDDDNVI